MSIVAALLVVLVAGYFIAQSMIRRKVEAALRSLPATFIVSYGDIQPSLLNSSLVISGLKIRVQPGPDTLHRHELAVDQMKIGGIHFLSLMFSKKSLHIGSIRLEGCRAELDDELLDKPFPFPKQQSPFTEALLDEAAVSDIIVKGWRAGKSGRKEVFSFEGSLRVDSVGVRDLNKGMDSSNLRIGGIHLSAREGGYVIPGAYERVRIKDAELDSRGGMLCIAMISVAPTVDRLELGRIKGVQTDVVDARCDDIRLEGLDVFGLAQHRLTADGIMVGSGKIHVFRDRRLRRETDEKPLPVDFLKSLPMSLRVKEVKFGTSSFTYEEFPGKGDSTGTIRIVRMTGSLSPLINKPIAGDPAWLTLTTKGSLMGSGTVTATTRMPLRRGEPYHVEGAFHELDVTTLNSSAENLGLIHLKSGVLNSLAFQFDMGPEKSTGKVIGAYHQLVVQKLKEKDDVKKVDKLKSFALKEFIIPLNKDQSLPESKRTGKVDYKRDPSRNFSFYLLHSLLVGVKSSFSLGFLLPG
ncbi:MAG TPA: hypothetical protein VK563_05220 [Puia sp.]|nr:hypothetical protein [Puia sp.]